MCHNTLDCQFGSRTDRRSTSTGGWAPSLPSVQHPKPGTHCIAAYRPVISSVSNRVLATVDASGERGPGLGLNQGFRSSQAVLGRVPAADLLGLGICPTKAQVTRPRRRPSTCDRITLLGQPIKARSTAASQHARTAEAKPSGERLSDWTILVSSSSDKQAI
jgi:hypothetical protein